MIRSSLMFTLAASWLSAASFAAASANPDQVAIDACIDELLASGFTSVPGGTVLGSSFSQAGTEVFLQDAGQTVWRCIAYQDGQVGVLEKATPEQIDAVQSAPQISDFQEIVAFEAGASGTDLQRVLEPGGAFQFLLDARQKQTMRIEIKAEAGSMYYIIRNPDGSILQPGTDVSQPFAGNLLQTGEHTIELVSQSSGQLAYTISFEIQ